MMFGVGYYAVCGARGCIRQCMISSEESGRIGQQFHNKFRKKPMWLLDPAGNASLKED